MGRKNEGKIKNSLYLGTSPFDVLKRQMGWQHHVDREKSLFLVNIKRVNVIWETPLPK